MIRGLPYDAEVEYLESTGTQYIDTGLKSISDIRYAMSLFWLAGYDFGSQYIGQGNGWFFGRISNLWRTPGNTGITTFGNVQYKRWYSVSFRRTTTNITLSVDDATYMVAESRNASAVNAWLFAISGTGNEAYKCKCRIACCKIYDHGVLVRDFIPVRFTNEQGVSEGAMYDRVTKKLFRNQGTGAFILGPDKARPVLSLHRYGASRFGKIGAGARMMRHVFTARDYKIDKERFNRP